jgi:hypothetical protein
MSTTLKVILVVFVLPLCGLVLWAYYTYGSGGVLAVGLATVILVGMARKPASGKSKAQRDREYWEADAQRETDDQNLYASQANSRGHHH